MGSLRKVLKVLLYLWIAFHLMAVLLLPNREALETLSVQSLILPYANQLGFNSHWRFFSPGPTPAIFMEYQVYRDEIPDFDSGSESEIYVFPERKEDYSYSSTYIRRMYTLRFYGFNRIALENYFVPYLCRKHSGARSISMRTYTYVIPRLMGDQEVTDFRNDSVKKTFEKLTVDCPVIRVRGEEDLEVQDSGGFLDEDDYVDSIDDQEASDE